MKDGANQNVIGLQDLKPDQVGRVGGKAANLAELARLDGLVVPPGFCVTTGAYEQALARVPSLDEHLDALARLDPGDLSAIRARSARLRQALERVRLPGELCARVTEAVTRLGDRAPLAIRSSATAEDSRASSFAGQHDTFLNVMGPKSVLEHIPRCWASLFTERAVAYRLRAGMDHRAVRMAVVVQQLVEAQSAGVVFTADPVTGNRTLAVVEASFGLGEGLVSGRSRPDVFRVRKGSIIAADIAAKPVETVGAPGGGTVSRPVESRKQQRPALSDAQVLRLVRLSRKIEAHFRRPQDIEWCLKSDAFHVVQSRPITTLFPIPTAEDGEQHAYVSVGHQQMMTDAMKPLGLSFWLLTTRAPMREAGGRLFVDVTRNLASPATRQALIENFLKADPLTGDALRALVERGDFTPTALELEAGAGPVPGSPPPSIATDPAIVRQLIEQSEASLAALRRDIQGKSGPELLDFIAADLEELKRILFDPTSFQAILAGMDATWWLNDHLHEWLGEKNAADALAQSAPGNVTSEMGLALMDVADAIRPYPDVVAFLRQTTSGEFLDELPTLSGGEAARDAIQAYLDQYGMRCVGEIDISRPRWSERPRALLPLILSNLTRFQSGAGTRRFEQGRRDAESKQADVLERLRALPDGDNQAAETKRMIERLRTFVGYREYPKYTWMSRYFAYKQALLAEARRLVEAHALRDADDIFFLRFDELQQGVRTGQVDQALIDERKQAFREYEALTPPRVITSDGEVITASSPREGAPRGALLGVAASGGSVEGRARVIFDIKDADFVQGDILVTVFTDPSWTPAFVGIEALVTEVGGLMTHGAVVAREYGLAAVVGVEQATRRIRDGQRIRVNGTEGWVLVLE